MTDAIQETNAPRSAATRIRFVLPYLLDSALLAIAIALGIAFIELLLVSADPHWLGGDPTQWRETLLTITAYWAFLAAATFVLALFIRIATRHAWIDIYLPAVTGLLAGAGLWVFLRRFSPDVVAIQIEFAFFASLGLATLIALLFAKAKVLRLRLFAIQAIAVLVGAIAVLRHSTILLALEESRVELPATIALGWLTLTSLLAIAFCLLLHRQHVQRRVTIAVAAVAFALPAILCAIPVWRGFNLAADKPNFLLISADTLRADDCSIYGGPVAMPALESFAEGAVVIDRFYATAPWTVPSLCSMFSGRFPVSLTPGLDDDASEAEETTLHRLYSYWRGASGPTMVDGMRIQGYRTMAVVANPATNAHQWLWQDFDSYQLVNAAANEAYGPFTQAPLFRNALNAIRPGTIQDRPFDSTRRAVHYAKTILKNHTGEPFFLWVHFMDPHSPYDPPPHLRKSHDRWSMFPPTPEESVAEPDWPYNMTDDEKAYARAQYRAETAYIDSALGQILGALDHTGKYDATYVCFFSDHGEEFWEHDRWGHGQTLFEEQLHVPFVIKGPRIRNGRIREPISAIDFAPTIADLFGLMKNTGWHGQSFSARLRNPDATVSPRPIFAQSTQHAMYQAEPLQMVLDDQLKYVRSLESPFRGLYDLATDPAERNNLLEDQPEDADRLERMLETWSKSFPSTVQSSLSGGILETDPEVLETLKSIGYGAE